MERDTVIIELTWYHWMVEIDAQIHKQLVSDQDISTY